jgi:hypothetical protein
MSINMSLSVQEVWRKRPRKRNRLFFFFSLISSSKVVYCNMWGLEACNGGDPLTAHTYMSMFGIPTESCVPYVSGSGKRMKWKQ